MPLKSQLFRYALRILGNREEAEDVVAETLVRLWDRRDTIKPDSNTNAFAMKITRNLCLDKFRSKHYKNRGVNIDDVEYELKSERLTPEKYVEYENVKDLINEIIQDFPEKWRTVFQLRDIEGYTNDEVVNITGWEINIVKITLSRARKRIRETLINKYDYRFNERGN